MLVAPTHSWPYKLLLPECYNRSYIALCNRVLAVSCEASVLHIACVGGCTMINLHVCSLDANQARSVFAVCIMYFVASNFPQCAR